MEITFFGCNIQLCQILQQIEGISLGTLLVWWMCIVMQLQDLSLSLKMFEDVCDCRHFLHIVLILQSNMRMSFADEGVIDNDYCATLG